MVSVRMTRAYNPTADADGAHIGFLSACARAVMASFAEAAPCTAGGGTVTSTAAFVGAMLDLEHR